MKLLLLFGLTLTYASTADEEAVAGSLDKNAPKRAMSSNKLFNNAVQAAVGTGWSATVWKHYGSCSAAENTAGCELKTSRVRALWKLVSDCWCPLVEEEVGAVDLVHKGHCTAEEKDDGGFTVNMLKSVYWCLKNRDGHDSSLAMASIPTGTSTFVNIFAAIGLCFSCYGAFRHYTK